MKGKRIRFEILIGVALLLIVSGAVGMKISPEREADKTISNRFGDVTWNHELHVRMKEIGNCSVCHHTELPGTMTPKPCHDCHKLPENGDDIITPELFMTVEDVKYEGTNGPPGMTALHGKCLGCHKAMKRGPVICRDCHAQTFSGLQNLVEWDHTTHSRKMDMDNNSHNDLEGDCVACHHKDEKAETEADYRPCGVCHRPAMEKGIDMATGIKDHFNAKHGQCQSCHVEFNPEDNNIACTDCHSGMRVDSQQTKPALEQAIHGRCGKCHNKDNENLEEATPKYCADCHKPDPSWIVFPQMRSIFWDHKKHGQLEEGRCEECHHKDIPEGPKLACRGCHEKEFYNNSSFEEALKKNCLSCHKEKSIGLDSWESITSEKVVPKYFSYKDKEGEFRWDHAFHALDASFSCRNCHHNIIKKNGEYATALRVGKDWPEEAGRIMSCGNCHGEDGPMPESVAWNTKAPKESDVLKKICVECHQKLGGGPQVWKDFFTTEPL